MPEEPKPDETQQTDDSGGFLIRKCGEGEGFKIGPDIEVRVNKVAGSKVYVAVKAPRDTKILRSDRS